MKTRVNCNNAGRYFIPSYLKILQKSIKGFISHTPSNKHKIQIKNAVYWKLLIHTISSIIGYPGQVNKMCSNDFIRNRITTRQEHLIMWNLQLNRQTDFINNCWWGFCDIQNNQGWGGGYHPKPKAEADNPFQDLDYSGYHQNWS